MATAAKTAYTQEQTVELLAAYIDAPTTDTVEAYAQKFGKTVKSVIAKLSREGVYQKKTYVRKDGSSVEKKDTTADAIGKILGLDEASTESLTKANRKALQAIFQALANSRPV